MSLTKEKEILYKLASESGMQTQFEVIDKNAVSYFKPYTNCKHMSKLIDIFCSEDLAEIRNTLQYLWNTDNETVKYIPCVLAALKKSQISEQGRFHDLELYNYMM